MADKEKLKVLVNMNRSDWQEFQRLAGRYRASMVLRKIVRRELDRAAREGITRFQ